MKTNITYYALFILLIFIPLGLTIASPIVNEKGHTVENWEKCGKEAINKELDEMVKKGLIASVDQAGAFGASGRGQLNIIEAECGEKPTDGNLSGEMKELLKKGCTDTQYEELPTAIKYIFDPFAENSKLIKNAKIMCAKIYKKNNTRQANKKESNRQWSVKRFYQSSEIGVRVVIETDRKREIKCAVYDRSGNPLAVRTGFITAPIDELQIIISSGIKSVNTTQCWSNE